MISDERMHDVSCSCDIGACMSQVSLDMLDDHDMEEIRRLLARRLVLRFPGQNLDARQFVRFASRLGRVGRQRLTSTSISPPERDFILVASGDGSVKPLRADSDTGHIWHADATTSASPPSLAILYTKVAPRSPPLSSFISMLDVYERLPASLKSRIAHLHVRHHVFPGGVEVSVARNAPAMPYEHRNSGQIHPLVYRHPVLGRPCLLLPYRRDSIVIGMNERDSRALLDALWMAVEEASKMWTTSLEAQDVLVWDNIATVHNRGQWPVSEAYLAWYTTLEGGPLSGAFAPVPA